MADTNLTREQQWARLEAHLGSAHGAEITDAMKHLYTLFTRDMLKWAAGLYDDETGGFYYSNSARDTEGYAPDIESTHDFFHLLIGTGAIPANGRPTEQILREEIPQWLQEKVVNYLYDLQDPDGYFYNFQWPKETHTVSRLGRDRGSAKGLLRGFGREPKYTTPAVTTEEGKTSVPERYWSEANFRKYLEGLNITTRSYNAISEILTQAPQIEEHGASLGVDLVKITMDWMLDNIRPDNGLWQPEVTYYSVNGLHKATRLFNWQKTLIPHIEKGIRNTMSVILSDARTGGVVDIYNPWHVLSDCMKNLRTYGDPALADQLQEEILAMAADGIRKSRAKMLPYRYEDGSFSYCAGHSCPTNQGMPSAIPDTPEGDANGNGCAVIGLVPSIFGALNADSVFVPIFTEEDRDYTFDLLEKMRKH